VSIAVSLKVHDGVVLAADSASTLFGQDPVTKQVGISKVYNNANKVFNLHKGLPIGMLTWGLGGIENASISTLAKDLRLQMSEGDQALKTSDYTLEKVATRVYDFFYKEHYVPTFASTPAASKPDLGLIVAGYSAGETLAEEWRIDIVQGNCAGPTPVRDKKTVGIAWNGQGEAISRIVFGFGTGIAQALTDMGVPNDQLQPALMHFRRRMEVPFVPPAMPIQDAIDLARFLVDATVQFTRFAPGAATVGGPIEIAAITKHEGFKWVCRKFYYEDRLNPGE
jgi:hypothetical protein